MQATQIATYARALYAAHGDKAEAEAAQKAVEAKAAGHPEQARNWQAVRASIRNLRGPNQG